MTESDIGEIAPYFAGRKRCSHRMAVSSHPMRSASGGLIVYMAPTTPHEILKYIDKLDINKAAGSDEISCLLIKLTRLIIAPVLSRLFNVCIFKSVFPDLFKIAKVIPLFKGGDRHILGN